MKAFYVHAALFVVFLGVLGGVQGVTLEVRNGNSTCIKAELSAVFSISYNASGSMRTVPVTLPDSATVDSSSSSCGTDGSTPWLVAVFGSGHALGLSFSTNGSLYSVANLTLQYNLSDATVFPGANSSDVVTVVSASVGIWAPVNTTYRCLSNATFRLDTADVTFSDMRLQAYMTTNDLNPNESVCLADQTPTPAPPRPTTVPVPVPTPAGPPERGTYNVTQNNTVCLLAQMGLQLNVTYTDQSNKTVGEVVNVNPDLTSSSGSCQGNSATLILTQEQTTTLTLSFTLNSTSNRYHLSAVSLVANWPDLPGNFSASNDSLNYLRSSLGHSYMCNAEQTLVILSTFSINTFRLQVQPFGVTTTQFASAEECQVDQDQMLIPIIVGAALAGLVLIVLIAYLIGRKRSHAGYQTI